LIRSTVSPDRRYNHPKSKQTLLEEQMTVAEPRKVAADEQVGRRREESREAIAQILELLGYPEDWAGELERLSFARGRVWRDAP
jgi:hypothetical protein